MIVTKKALPRRTILRGIGATVALPLLDSMVPACTALAKSPARPTKRFGVVYVPNGIVMNRWTPTSEGSGFEFTPTLKPLESFRERLLVVSGLDNTASKLRPGGGGGAHARPGAAFLSGCDPVATTGTARLELGVSMDQILAGEIGRQTPVPSLELSLEGDGALTCDPGFSCAYLNISWRNEHIPMPMETDPRVVFERLFGDSGSTDPSVRLARMRRSRSILDSVADKVNSLRSQLASSDRAKLHEYLDSVREVERRIQVGEERGVTELPAIDSPEGIPFSYEDHARLMFDLQVLAYQSDLTRVNTFMVGRELSGATYPQIGVNDSHHPITHHAGDEKLIEKVAKINHYHVSLFAEYLGKLQAVQDGDGTLLDHVTILYGSGLSEGSRHVHTNLPILVAGGGAGDINSGRHLRYAEGTNLTNLQLTLMRNMEVAAERFGNSDGTLDGITL